MNDYAMLFYKQRTEQEKSEKKKINSYPNKQ